VSRRLHVQSLGEMDRLVISFVRSLRAANLSERTQQSYEEGVLQLSAFLSRPSSRSRSLFTRRSSSLSIFALRTTVSEPVVSASSTSVLATATCSTTARTVLSGARRSRSDGMGQVSLGRWIAGAGTEAPIGVVGVTRTPAPMSVGDRPAIGLSRRSPAFSSASQRGPRFERSVDRAQRPSSVPCAVKLRRRCGWMASLPSRAPVK
jgi:hypothetical protein